MPQNRPFIFKDGRTELLLPVTPGSYRVEYGRHVEVVNIHELGDVVVLGYGTATPIHISCMFPANPYPFARDSHPEPYIEQFKRWIDAEVVVRFIVGGTGVNIPVKIHSIPYGEEDGTNDVYADIMLREYRQPEAVQLTAPAANLGRAKLEETARPSVQNHIIVSGDTLSALCRRYYGDGSPAMWTRLAKYNGIANPHLIFSGNNLKIPNPLPL